MAHECDECGGDIHPKRYALGYRVCLTCGDTAARKKKFCIVPANKSNYMVVSNRAELRGLNPKRVE